MSEADAVDVVDMLHESLLDAMTLDTGKIDFGRKGGMSMAKQVGIPTTINIRQNICDNPTSK